MTVTVDDIVSYMGGEDDAVNWLVEGDYPEIENALAAESSAQGNRVVYPVDENGDLVAAPDLDEALKRRVVRNLAMRTLPTAINFDETGSTRIGAQDPEIRRLEGPYLRMSVG